MLINIWCFLQQKHEVVYDTHGNGYVIRVQRGKKNLNFMDLDLIKRNPCRYVYLHSWHSSKAFIYERIIKGEIHKGEYYFAALQSTYLDLFM